MSRNGKQDLVWHLTSLDLSLGSSGFHASTANWRKSSPACWLINAWNHLSTWSHVCLMIMTPPCTVLSAMVRQAMFGDINSETLETFGDIGDIQRHWRHLETLGDIWRQRETLETLETSETLETLETSETLETLETMRQIFMLNGHSVKVGNLTNCMCLSPTHENLLGDMFSKDSSPSSLNVTGEKFLSPQFFGQWQPRHSEKLCWVFQPGIPPGTVKNMHQAAQSSILHQVSQHLDGIKHLQTTNQNESSEQESSQSFCCTGLLIH